ncbi:MAG: response regulator [Desulfovibrio sp.]|jgi:PAS domain S-box-containing protein|nr:response regulator [Desulfovibrio sp.]
MWKISGEQFPSVRKLLLGSFSVGMLVLFFLTSIVIYFQYVQYSEGQADLSRSSANHYQAVITSQRALMDSLLDVIATDSRLYGFFESRDAGGMAAAYQAAFERLREERRISSLVFIDARRRVLAGIGHPGNMRSAIPDSLFSEAERSGASVISLGRGRAGELAMRVMKALFSQGSVLGYIEAVADLGDIVRVMSKPQSMSLLFLLNEAHEDMIPPPSEARSENSSPALWLDAGKNICVYAPEKSLDENFLLSFLEQISDRLTGNKDKYFTVFFNYDHYSVSSFPLRNSSGSSLGDLIIFEKNELMWRGFLITAVLLSLGLGVILVCLRVVSVKLTREDARLASMMAKISANDALFENVFTESETGFVLQNWITGEILQANSVALAIFDVREPSHIDLAHMRPLSPEDVSQTNWQTSDANSPLMSIVTKQGTAYCELSHFFLGENEEIQCIAIRDVTRVVNLQNSNKRQIKYLQEVIDQLPGMVFIKDSDCRLTMYNAVFEQIFGEGRSLIGKTHFADWLGHAMDAMLAREQDSFASGKAGTFEYSFVLRDGKEHTFLVSQKLISRSSGNGGSSDLLCVCMDITERSQMEKQLLHLRIKAEEANQSKSRFLAHMSHEIRTPMNVVLGMSHLALSANPDDQQRNYLSKISGAAKNLLGIINDILDFSKIEAGEMTVETIPFSLNDLCLELEASVRMLLMDKSVEFTLSLPEMPGNVMGDPLRLRQVLLNLVNNAIKFTRQGYVSLSCRIQEEHEHRYVLQFSVADTGIGIPKEAIERLFTSFQQVDSSTTRKYGGTGLGLSISQQLVRLMGGSDISVSSVEGEGATFAFILTLGKTARVEETLREGAAVHGRGERQLAVAPLPESAKILVVEDNEINQEIIVALLKRHHVQVTAVSNGQEAVRAVEADVFDLVLMDLQMPVMDGLDAAKAIRTLPLPSANAVPIIALTANAMTDDRDRCLAVGMNDFLSKPIDVEQLNHKLHLWLVPSPDKNRGD